MAVGASVRAVAAAGRIVASHCCAGSWKVLEGRTSFASLRSTATLLAHNNERCGTCLVRAWYHRDAIVCLRSLLANSAAAA